MMKPTAIQVAEYIYYSFHSAEDLYLIDPDQAVLALKDVIYILNKCGIPAPDFELWASVITDKNIKPNNRLKHKMSNKIKAAMKAKKINQVQLADLMGKRKEFVNKCLAGGNMTLNTIILFQNALGVKLLDLEPENSAGL